MAEALAKYTPQAVRVPAGAGVERSFAEYEISDETRALCDATTVFCDVFRSANGKEVVCIGPPFLDFGYPRAVRLAGRRRRFVVEEMPWGTRRASILRVLGTSDVDSADDPNVDLQVDFPAFGIDVRVRLPRMRPPGRRAALTLHTVQKDNELQWLEDWCNWHHRAHGVGRFVFYDNGSTDRDAVHAELARRVKGPELIVVDWDYPYGPPWQHGLKFAHTVALNHCRLLFGPYTHWCINLDVDEYLRRQILGTQHEQVCAREVRQPRRQLVCVAPSPEVAVMVVPEVVVVRRRVQRLRTAGQALLLRGERLRERQCLVAACRLVSVVRERPLDRVAQDRQELHRRVECRHTGRRQGVGQVVGRSLERDAPGATAREVRPIPVRAPVVEEVEVVHFLAHRRRHLRVPPQGVEQRPRAALLCADHQERRRDTVRRAGVGGDAVRISPLRVARIIPALDGRACSRARGAVIGARRSALGARRSALGARRSALGARRSALGARRS